MTAEFKPGPNCRELTSCKGIGKGRNCRTCANWALAQNPDVVARRAAGMIKHLQDPEARRQHGERLNDARRKWRADPNNEEIERERGRLHALTVLHRPDIRARNISPECRARAGRSYSNNLLSWCPLEYRPLYHKLRHTMPAAEARAAVEDQVRVDLIRHQRTGKLQATGGIHGR